MPQGTVVQNRGGVVAVQFGERCFYVEGSYPFEAGDPVSIEFARSGERIQDLQAIPKQPVSEQRSTSDVAFPPVDLSGGNVNCQFAQHSVPDHEMREAEEVVDEEPEPHRITVCTWNINHLSDATENKEDKLRAVRWLLKTVQPDVLVLQEINRFNMADKTKWDIDDHTYTWHFGPLFASKGASKYVEPRQSWQYEYYAALVSERLAVKDSYTLMTYSRYDAARRDAQIDWTEHRGTVVLELEEAESGRSFLLGIIHTSPSFKVTTSGYEAVRGLDARAGDSPWILAGDWYVEREFKVSASHTKGEWQEILDSRNAKLWNTVEDTNFPWKGEGMPADYFITSGQWRLASGNDASVVLPPSWAEGKVIQINLGRAGIRWAGGYLDALAVHFDPMVNCGNLLENDHGTLGVGQRVIFRYGVVDGSVQLMDGSVKEADLLMGRGWRDLGLSDHAPVAATFLVG